MDKKHMPQWFSNPGTSARIEGSAGAVLLLCLYLAGWALWPGLGGQFIFDDSWNLRGLEDIAQDPTASAAAQYVFHGISSTLGRPLALATFAFQYASWPFHPEDFIRFNILLHLLNGCLLAWCLVRLLRLMRVPAAPMFAVLGAALWLFAPLNASAVLYVVQRMAVLAGTCVFLGLLMYLIGRDRLARGHTPSGLVWMSLGVFAGLGMGVLAKENAALFPLSILVLELTLLRDQPRPLAWRTWCAVALLLPTVLLLAYIAMQIPSYLAITDARGFTIYERLLTEARVLFLYLQKLLVPSLYSVRLLYDDLEVSRTLLSPLTTLLSVIAWIGLLATALLLRARASVFSFAVLWYLAHHLLESTVVPLELAFEHRNYVASVGPVFALIYYLWRAAESARAHRLRGWILAAGIAYLTFQWIALWQTATLWGHPLELSRHWAQAQPTSTRAQLQLADSYLRYGNIAASVAIQEQGMSRWPGDPTFPLAILEIGCYVPEGPVPSFEQLERSAALFDAQVLSTINMLDRLISTVEEGRCERYGPVQLYGIVELISGIPAFAGQLRNFLLMRSRIAELAGDRTAAMAYLDQTLGLQAHITLISQAIYWSLQAGDLARAKSYLKMAETIKTSNPLKKWEYENRLAQLRELVAFYENDSGK